MRRKGIVILVSLSVMASMLCGCAIKEKKSSTANENTETTTTEQVTEISEEETIQAEEEAIWQEEVTQTEAEAETVDFSYLYGAPVKVNITVKQVNADVSTYTDEAGNEWEDRRSKVDIIDTGSGYRLNVDSVAYDLKVSRDEFDEFIQQAIENDGVYETDMNGDKLCVYNIIEGKDILVIMGESFRLTYCKDRGMGRGYMCEFLGEDDQIYQLVTNLESEIDDYTGKEVWMLVKDGEIGNRRIMYEEDAYIDIPYNMAENTDMAACAKGDRYYTNSSPTGVYNMQFDQDGSIIRLEDLWVGAY